MQVRVGRSTPETGNRPKERIAQILGIRLENVAEESVKPPLPQGMAGGVLRQMCAAHDNSSPPANGQRATRTGSRIRMQSVA